MFFKPLLNASAPWDTTIACNSTSNVTLEDLQKYTQYEIMVSAFNILGPGNFSEVVTSFTDEDSEWILDRSILFFFCLVVPSFAPLYVSLSVCVSRSSCPLSYFTGDSH